MSRAPYPGGRVPPAPNGAGTSDSHHTRPLQLGRTSRPTTPSNSSGPARPARSDMRMRQASEYSVSDAGSSRVSEYSAYARDSTARPEPPRPPRARNGTNGGLAPPRPSQDRTETNGSIESPTDISPTSPSINVALGAFRSAATRQRTNGADSEWERERERELQEEQARQQRIRDRVPGRRPTQGMARTGDIDAVLDQIKDEWEFVIDADFNPVDLALQLLDDGSSGRSEESFRRTKTLLGRALKGSVEQYHQAFAGSLPQHSSMFNHIDSAQLQIKDARTALQESKEALGNKRADLVQIWSRGQTVEEMIRILDQIEHLKTVADSLETLIAEKRFLQASVLLVRSLKVVNNAEMQDIGALADLRSYLTTQETALREILVDEIHSHLYLKSFWCGTRWSSYAPSQQTLQKAEFEEEPIANVAPKRSSLPPSRRSRLARFLDDLALRTNESPYDTSELNPPNSANGQFSITTPSMSFTDSANLDQNPEADSFAYLESLLESLAVLGKLGNALDVVAQRVSSEIYSLVDSTVEDVSERAEYNRRTSVLNGTTQVDSSKSQGVYVFVTETSAISEGIANTTVPYGKNGNGYLHGSSLRLSALESTAKHMDHEVLKDLFWTLYSKFDAVLQGLRVIYEVANRIGSRRDFKDSSGTKPGSLFPLPEVWLPINGEVRTMLQDYITDEEQGAVAGRNPISSINEVLREGRATRDRTKPVFRFGDTSSKWVTSKLKPHEDELNRALKDTVPGLVQANAENAAQVTLSTIGSDERMLGVGQHHRLIIKPDTFHVSVLFQPTLAFLERIADVLPAGLESARASTLLLDDFVLKQYLPQLEEKVSSLFYHALSGPDSFQADPSSSKLSPKPLIKASTQLMALVNSLCAMLRTAPFHRENHARLLLSVVIQFYQRCYDRFQSLVTTGKSAPGDAPPEAILAAQWAQTPVFTPGLGELLNSDADLAKRQKLSKQETQLELGAMGQSKIRKDQLIASMRNLSELCILHHSVAWFATELSKLKMTEEEPMSPATSALEPMSAFTPAMFTPLPIIHPVAPNEGLTLPLSKDMSLRFHALLKTYDILAELILYTIRIDMRCRTMHFLDLAMSRGAYDLSYEVAEPEPHVVDLNTELSKCEDVVSSALRPQQRRFVFDGLGQLMEHSLIANTRFVKSVTASGIKRLLRNTMALQQCMKILTPDDSSTEFERAKRYYNLFYLTPAEMLDGVRQKQEYSFDEYKSMLALQCGVDQTLGDQGAQRATDRNYPSYVIDLHGLEMASPT